MMKKYFQVQIYMNSQEYSHIIELYSVYQIPYG